jgi:small subunit ribosomal protein S21
MIVVNVKENESIEKALKRFKKKFERTGTLREVRSRNYFEKPSVTRRNERLKAAYRQKMVSQENN